MVYTDTKEWRTVAGYNYIRYRAAVEELEQDINGNRTKVRITFSGWSTFGVQYTGYTEYCGIGVDGEIKREWTNPYPQRLDGTEKTFGTWEGWITHDPDGTKDIDISVWLSNDGAADYRPVPTTSANPIQLTPSIHLTAIDRGLIGIQTGEDFRFGIPYVCVAPDDYRIGQGFICTAEGWQRGI